MVTSQEMGKKGGQAISPAKTAAARKNASKPRGRWVTAIAYKLADVCAPFDFGLVVTSGKPPSDDEKQHDWVCRKVRENGLGLENETGFEFLELMTTSMTV